MARIGKKKHKDDQSQDETPVDSDLFGQPEAPVEEAPKKPKGKKNDPANFTWESPVRPSAFLLPNYLTHRLALARAKKRTASMVVWGFLVLAIACVGSFGLHYMANVEKQEAEVTKVEAQKQLKGLAEASAFFSGLDLREQTVKDTLTADVDYSKVIGAVNDALPAGGSIDTLTTAYGATCPGPDPFVVVQAIGCVNFTISLRSAADVETFISRANGNEAGNVVSFLALSSSSSTNGGYSVVGTANFTANTFTYRFTKKEDAPATGQAADPNAVPTTPTPGAAQ